ncbi:TPA: hypothetical protein DCZ15_00360 [Candidatus Falkowbacteria bacterium]|uniref:Uncharacterized protein n=2 Tax=Candidatus Collieribacteriota TaxID=1752725 RepID=A0A0G1GPG7_9BACT|nr:MAG: hypothetical protein UW23_C0001G0040 [Candidatus Collierbacteria bacterium GW2011_GWA1_44_12]KKT39079.1 MAG: hypothetical protein UW26_C0008G0021 [Candidatus Collierbacteria bacterium GW2011_GWF1_44_12]HBA36310.1 hypothetical protein [Candidatus Falkowbacteria bacterium]
MRTVFSATLMAVGAVLWFTAWGWISALAVFGGMNFFGILTKQVREGSGAFYIVGLVTILLMVVFYVGAPVAAWLVWGHLEGIAYAMISIIGLVFLVRDANQIQPESIEN